MPRHTGSEKKKLVARNIKAKTKGTVMRSISRTVNKKKK